MGSEGTVIGVLVVEVWMAGMVAAVVVVVVVVKLKMMGSR